MIRCNYLFSVMPVYLFFVLFYLCINVQLLLMLFSSNCRSSKYIGTLLGNMSVFFIMLLPLYFPSILMLFPTLILLFCFYLYKVGILMGIYALKEDGTFHRHHEDKRRTQLTSTASLTTLIHLTTTENKAN